MIMEYTTDQQYTSEKCPILSFKAYLCCFKVKEILQGGRQEERREKQRERQWIFHLLVHCLKDCNAGSGPAWSRKLHCHFLVRGPSSWALICCFIHCIKKAVADYKSSNQDSNWQLYEWPGCNAVTSELCHIMIPSFTALMFREKH